MKRLALIAVIALGMASCAQHDPKSPDTGGNSPASPNRQTTAADSSDAANGMNNSVNSSNGAGNTQQYDSLPSSNNTGRDRNQ